VCIRLLYFLLQRKQSRRIGKVKVWEDCVGKGERGKQIGYYVITNIVYLFFGKATMVVSLFVVIELAGWSFAGELNIGFSSEK
jgi:hypothetical protein